MASESSLLTVTVDSLTDKGDGIAFWSDKKLFIPGALPGETVSIRCYGERPTYAQGELVSVDTAHESRIQPACPYTLACGGCQIAHLDYAAQLHMKQQQVRQNLHDRDIPVRVEPCLGMEHPAQFRNKGIYAVRQQEGQARIGFFRKNSHDVVDINACLMHPDLDQHILVAVRQWMTDFDIAAYDEAAHSGMLRYLEIRHGIANQQCMVVLVTASDSALPGQAALVQSLLALPGVTSILRNINSGTGNRILGEQTDCLAGSLTIHDQLMGFEFAISANSFYQVNASQTAVLYQQILQLAKLQVHERVFDLYCGIGSITLCLSQVAHEVVGIESVPEAIADARLNAERNHIGNVTFHAGKVEALLDDLYAEGAPADLVVLDPPRKGCELSVLATLVAHKPAVIIYVSCDPVALARDMTYLLQHGYQVDTVQPIDMFPHTLHVETVVRLVHQHS